MTSTVTGLSRCAECERRGRFRDQLKHGDNIHEHAGTHVVDSEYTRDVMYIVLPVTRQWILVPQ